MAKDSTATIAASVGQVGAVVAVINPVAAAGVVVLLVGSVVAYKIATSRLEHLKFKAGNVSGEAKFYES